MTNNCFFSHKINRFAQSLCIKIHECHYNESHKCFVNTTELETIQKLFEALLKN